MPVEVRVPALGESVVEATVGAWLKREGEAVKAGDALVQLETEKVNLDVSAESSGVLGSIQRKQGETVQPGDVLAVVEESAAPVEEPERAHASPVARRMADEHGLDLSKIQGSGTGGRVTREDVERHLAAASADGANRQAPAPPS